MTGAVAKRYARALFSLATDEGAGFEAIGDELARIAAVFREGRLAQVLGSAAIDAKTRAELAETLVTTAGLSPLVGNFIRVLAANGRLGAVEAIEAEYRRLSDRRLGQVRAKVRSAKPLADADVRAIAEAFEKRTGRKVLPEVEIDADLLGGVVVEIQGRAYDGSTRRELERLRAALAGQG
ncbi:MAG: ATP synthase F1 subunit delta [Candidatus Binatia bacterium]